MQENEKDSQPVKKSMLAQLVSKLGNRIRSSLNNDEQIIPEIIEQAQRDASDESILEAHHLQEYLKTQVLSSKIISETGAKLTGNLMEFPETGKVISLGLPDHNFHTMYGFRAELRGKSLDARRYIDLVVRDLEKRITHGSDSLVNYELSPLLETIEFELMRKYDLKRGPELNEVARTIEEKARKLLSNNAIPSQTTRIVIDVVVIPRIFQNTMRIFDVECYK